MTALDSDADGFALLPLSERDAAFLRERERIAAEAAARPHPLMIQAGSIQVGDRIRVRAFCPPLSPCSTCGVEDGHHATDCQRLPA